MVHSIKINAELSQKNTGAAVVSYVSWHRLLHTSISDAIVIRPNEVITDLDVDSYGVKVYIATKKESNV